VGSIMYPLVETDLSNSGVPPSPLRSEAQSSGQSNSMYYIHIVHSPKEIVERRHGVPKKFPFLLGPCSMLKKL
jgi:hypothetical protein